jgi:ankyrin repeat protein
MHYACSSGHVAIVRALLNAPMFYTRYGPASTSTQNEPNSIIDVTYAYHIIQCVMAVRLCSW